MLRPRRHARATSLCFALILTASGAGCEGTKKPVVGVDARVPEDAGLDARMPVDDAGHDASTDASTVADADVAGPGGPDATTLDETTTNAGTAMPTLLSQTGLYAKGSTSTLADGVLPYSVRYVLWADGASKQRWLYLPPGTEIDTSDMDAWVFPVGTKVWKEFSVDGKRLETRVLWKTTENAWFKMAFVWNEDGSDAVASRRGESDVAGTTHDVPSRTACGECHDGARDVLLGVSAIQLSHDEAGVTLQTLADDGKLSSAPAADFRLPDTREWNALGYLHANCGNCHNPASVTWDRVDLDLWLRTSELSAPTATQSYKTSIGVQLTELGGDLKYRVAAGDAEHSGLLTRMMTRGSEKAMPPLASEVVDSDGVALVREWIDSL